MKRHHIQLHRHPRSRSHKRASGSLLFVHGAYTDSRYWGLKFVPFFQSHGYDCFAVDLSGHGASGGKERLDEFGLDDYADDVARAVATIDQPVSLVGHSMGALAVQRYLEKAPAAGAVFMAPVPPTGTGASAAQLLTRYPGYLPALEATIAGDYSEENNDLLAKIYFAPDATGDDVLDFLPTVGPESQRAVMEMALLAMRPPVRRHPVPALVIGGETDALFPPSNLFFTALPWRAKVVRVPGAGHMLPIDRNWQAVAGHMLEWLSGNGANGAGQG